jgi:hypothetical protein
VRYRTEKGGEMFREIDSREISGSSGGRVSIETETDGLLRVRLTHPRTHPEGIPVVVTHDGEDALDAYRHPFARPRVPDIFKQ